jgi:hypothetical protein
LGDPHDIFKLLNSRLQGETLEVIVKDYDEKNYPSVEIYDRTGQLAYQYLINKNYFIEC